MLNEIRSFKGFRQFVSGLGTDQDSEEFWGPEGMWAYDDDLHGQLKKAGWKLEGTGAYGVVLSNPSYNYVLKFFLRIDTGYSAWVNWCVKNQSNIYVPKIFGRPMAVSTELAAVRIEKLHHGPQAKKLEQQISMWFESDYKDREIHDSVANRTDFLRVVGFIYGAAGTEHDIYHGSPNLMVRANGQPVVSDPLGEIHSNNWKVWNKLIKIGK